MWKILIVDDSLADLQLLRTILQGVAETYLAMNSREAIIGYECAMERGKPFDLMLLDMIMPGMDGYQVLQKVREMETSASIPAGRVMPIIMVTGHEKPFMKEFNRGCDDYMLKPVDPAALLKLINSKLKKG
ncbi:MAG: response regulator [Candidatus Omnitrophota bacterium]